MGKCKSILEPNTMFSKTAFIKTGSAAGIFGAYIGIQIDAKMLGGTKELDNQTSFLKSILRALSTAMIILPFSLPYFLLSNSSDMLMLFFFQ